MSTHILETATSTDINVFQQGMMAAKIGLHFDPLADQFWQAGWSAQMDLMIAKMQAARSPSGFASSTFPRETFRVAENAADTLTIT